MINLNKNKDVKFRLRIDSLPEKNKIDMEFWKENCIDEQILINYPSFLVEENYYETAKIFWESHVRVCTKEAFSSGLYAKEMAETPTVRGQFKQSEALFMILKDVFAIPIKCPWIYDDEIFWRMFKRKFKNNRLNLSIKLSRLVTQNKFNGSLVDRNHNLYHFLSCTPRHLSSL